MLDILIVKKEDDNRPSTERLIKYTKASLPKSARIIKVKTHEDPIQKCAERSLTNYFFLVEPTRRINRDFDFRFNPEDDLDNWSGLEGFFQEGHPPKRGSISIYHKSNILSKAFHNCKFPFYDDFTLGKDAKSIEEAAEKSRSSWFYFHAGEINILKDFQFLTPNEVEGEPKAIIFRDVDHLFTRRVRLVSKDYQQRNNFAYIEKQITEDSHRFKSGFSDPYDVVFLSYGEPNADKNFEILKKIAPNAKRVEGVKGILEAHRAAAMVAETPLVFIVDADAVIADEFKFDYTTQCHKQDIVTVWRSINAVNELIYGYGAVKLFPTVALRETLEWKVDLTTSLGAHVKIIHKVSNTTSFNTDPFNSWKSGFRECAKLASKIIARQKDDETNERLDIWCTKGSDKPFGDYCIRGAREGRKYGEKNKNNSEALSLINDFGWLKDRFESGL